MHTLGHTQEQSKSAGPSVRFSFHPFPLYDFLVPCPKPPPPPPPAPCRSPMCSMVAAFLPLSVDLLLAVFGRQSAFRSSAPFNLLVLLGSLPLVVPRLTNKTFSAIFLPRLLCEWIGLWVTFHCPLSLSLLPSSLRLTPGSPAIFTRSPWVEYSIMKTSTLRLKSQTLSGCLGSCSCEVRFPQRVRAFSYYLRRWCLGVEQLSRRESFGDLSFFADVHVMRWLFDQLLAGLQSNHVSYLGLFCHKL